CEAGYWGDQCDKTCNRGCVDGTCNRDDGQCQCAPGWREPSCAVCDDSHYGQDCSRDCGRCTGGVPCHITGRCPSCEPGYVPPLCQNSCPVKKYGQNCALSCGHCADNVTCHHVDGHCPDGCGSGYRGELCDIECATGRYGQNCSELCGNCHNKAICDHVTGHCPQGCPGNFSTTLCKVCVAGLWGENCTESCGQCAGDGSCDRMTAECSAGCVAGWNGTVCQQKVCVAGLWGENCTESCGQCAGDGSCDRMTAECSAGCVAGWNGTVCQQKVCVAGLWGENCTESCGQCAGDGSCDRMTAECSAGCVAGWNGTVCQQKGCKPVGNFSSSLCVGCVDGWYGDQCRTECSQNCSPLKCDQDDGGCEGCKAGYWGDQCDKTCSRGCVNGTCNRDHGQCQCAPGWRVPCYACDDHHYGDDCDGQCGNCTDGAPCDKTTGHCPSCKPGYNPPLCQNLCLEKTYGQNCSTNCGHCADDVTCHPVTGSCPDGCGPGYLGQRCDAECPTGQYGENCSESCGNCHNTTTCDHVNGHCPDRCRGNFSVPLCQERPERPEIAQYAGDAEAAFREYDCVLFYFIYETESRWTTFMTNQTVVENVVQDLSQVMDVPTNKLRQDNVGQRLLNVIERVSREGALSDGQLTATSPNLVISARAVDSRNFSGLTLTAFAGEDNHFQDGEVQAYSRTSVPETSDDISSLVLPANLLTSLGNVSRIATTVHVDGRLFEAIAPPPDTNGSDVDHVRKVNSYVMSASVVGHDEVINLQDPIVIGLVHVNKSSFLIRIQRMNTSSKILVSLCVALALSDLVFVVGMQDYTLKHPAACKAVSMLLHFCLLSSMCWMLMEAFYMYLSFVRIFRTISTDIILKFSCFAWGVPVLIVAITAGVSTADSYSPLDSGICWLTGTAFYAAFVGPVCLILLLNLVSFVLVLRVILGLTDKQETSQAAQKLRRAIGVVVLLGLTWVFGLLSIEDTSQIVFNYLFAVFNSLQGLFIFLFYCVFNKNTRAIWQRCFRTCVTSRPAGDVFLVTTTSDNTRSTDPVAATSSSV
ncbi:hypothetical protein BaRGS_00026831, partial [Batillaria attramentaria]